MCHVREMPTELLGQAQAAFAGGFAGAAVESAFGVAILGAFAALSLRHVRWLGPTQGKER